MTVAVTQEADIVVFLDQAVLLVASQFVDKLFDITGADTGDVELVKNILDFAGCFCAIGEVRQIDLLQRIFVSWKLLDLSVGSMLTRMK